MLRCGGEGPEEKVVLVGIFGVQAAMGGTLGARRRLHPLNARRGARRRTSPVEGRRRTSPVALLARAKVTAGGPPLQSEKASEGRSWRKRRGGGEREATAIAAAAAGEREARLRLGEARRTGVSAGR